MSKNEQRENLGRLIFSYFTKSINKYPKYANEILRTALLSNTECWMINNNWLNGKIEQARVMLRENKGTFEVSELLNMPLEAIEDIFLRLHDNGKLAEVHLDNVKASKGMPPV